MNRDKLIPPARRDKCGRFLQGVPGYGADDWIEVVWNDPELDDPVTLIADEEFAGEAVVPLATLASGSGFIAAREADGVVGIVDGGAFRPFAKSLNDFLPRLRNEEEVKAHEASLKKLTRSLKTKLPKLSAKVEAAIAGDDLQAVVDALAELPPRIVVPKPHTTGFSTLELFGTLLTLRGVAHFRRGDRARARSDFRAALENSKGEGYKRGMIFYVSTEALVDVRGALEHDSAVVRAYDAATAKAALQELGDVDWSSALDGLDELAGDAELGESAQRLKEWLS